MSEVISENVFDRLADDSLHKMVEALANLEDDRLDCELESGVLTISFDDGVRFVVNSHRAARQIWMAAGAQAWHFDWDGRAWISTKTHEDLWALLEAKVSMKLGQPVSLR